MSNIVTGDAAPQTQHPRRKLQKTSLSHMWPVLQLPCFCNSILALPVPAAVDFQLLAMPAAAAAAAAAASHQR
jgi:hypothetical protein